MLLRKKLYFLVFTSLLIIYCFSHLFQRLFLPVPLAPSTSQVTRQDTVVEATESQAIFIAKPPSAPSTPTAEKSKPADTKSCECETCISDMEGSEWFRQYYDPKQEPILQNANKDFDPDAIDWWLRLQQSDKGQNLQEVMSDMFQVISPHRKFDSNPSPCQKCAVVGNSGNLQRSGYGLRIDSHDFVIRMNKAVTQRFENDVGKKTTHHFLYPESAVDVNDGVSLVLLPFKPRDLEWIASALSTGKITKTYMRVKERVKADKNKVLVVNPVFFKYVHDKWTDHHGRYPSTGIVAIIFALHVCDQVSVFGYGADEQGNWHHYWEENRYAGAFKKTGVHNATFEESVIKRLDKAGIIKLYE